MNEERGELARKVGEENENVKGTNFIQIFLVLFCTRPHKKSYRTYCIIPQKITAPLVTNAMTNKIKSRKNGKNKKNRSSTTPVRCRWWGGDVENKGMGKNYFCTHHNQRTIRIQH